MDRDLSAQEMYDVYFGGIVNDRSVTSLDYYRRHRTFISRDGAEEWFCVIDESRRLMSPAMEDIGLFSIPIPWVIGDVKFGQVIICRPGVDGACQWSNDGF